MEMQMVQEGDQSCARHSCNVYHILKMTNKGIGVCKAVIPNSYSHRYLVPFNKKTNKKSANKRARERINKSINKHQTLTLHGSAESVAIAEVGEIIDVDTRSNVGSVT